MFAAKFITRTIVAATAALSLAACSDNPLVPEVEQEAAPAAEQAISAEGLKPSLDTYASGGLSLWYNGSRLSHTSYSSSNFWSAKVEGRLTDVAANDGRCSRVYVRASNGLGMWTSWAHRGTACAGGNDLWASENYHTHRYRFQLKLCAGTSTSGSLCKYSEHINF